MTELSASTLKTPVMDDSEEQLSTSGSAGSSPFSLLPLGHLTSSWRRNGGPVIHLLSKTISRADKPLVASSDGFRAVLTCCHFTLLATKVRNFSSVFVIYCSTNVLSVQKTESSSCMSSSERRYRSACSARTAAHSSRRGMVCCSRGANFAFPNTNEHYILPSFSMRRYETMPYALCDASQKWCSCTEDRWTIPAGV